MKKLRILLLLGIIAVVFMGCDATKEMEKLPENQNAEISHNNDAGLTPKEEYHEKATLDEKFIDENIDTKAFRESINDATDGIEDVKERFPGEKATAKDGFNKAENKAKDTEKSVESQASMIKTQAEQMVKEAETEADEKLDEFKNKNGSNP